MTDTMDLAFVPYRTNGKPLTHLKTELYGYHR